MCRNGLKDTKSGDFPLAVAHQGRDLLSLPATLEGSPRAARQPSPHVTRMRGTKDRAPNLYRWHEQRRHMRKRLLAPHPHRPRSAPTRCVARSLGLRSDPGPSIVLAKCRTQPQTTGDHQPQCRRRHICRNHLCPVYGSEAKNRPGPLAQGSGTDPTVVRYGLMPCSNRKRGKARKGASVAGAGIPTTFGMHALGHRCLKSTGA